MPLADRLRPTTLSEVVGQQHLVGEGQVLRRVVESGTIPNLIFYGPSGVGKTTVARIIAKMAGKKLHRLNGTTASTADIKAVVGDVGSIDAQNGVVLYLDEIQYLNKKQQQTLLEFIEDGSVTLIASTTENPYFYIYNAILSRSTVFEFRPVEASDIIVALRRGFQMLGEENDRPVQVPEEVLDYISHACGGDVRKAINAAEMLYLASGTGKEITVEEAQAVSQRSAMRYDRDGDVHYDLLSAFQKSIRGSDPDAGLHYLARILEGGDLISACRRLLVMASEDVGLAYPLAVTVVKSCVDSAVQLGLPEGRIPLAQAVVLLATSPKSNASYMAFDRAMEDVKKGNYSDPPDSLKDGHYPGAQKMGHAIGYQYPHMFPDHYIEQQYLPDKLRGKKYYEFGSNKNEQAAKAYWDRIKGKKESE